MPMGTLRAGHVSQLPGEQMSGGQAAEGIGRAGTKLMESCGTARRYPGCPKHMVVCGSGQVMFTGTRQLLAVNSSPLR